MTRNQKKESVEVLNKKLNNNNIIYLADISNLDSVKTQELRKECFNRGVSMSVVKNTLLKIAMKNSDKNLEELYDTLKDNTALMLSEVPNAPAKLIKDFRSKSDKPILKGAWIDEAVYVGDDNLVALVAIKSKQELIAEVISLLQSPVKNVVSSLESSKNTLSGILKTLENKK